ncbi:MAG: hypothetical protein CO093_06860 [Alphaproteobacteria bacterium CG_4_9_14_3_um_filter_47_13]|nr:MAG: hypothetical protein CO093_06860 [Alphaproteobacteria bacterium CG_4_9_14_3_um_filter_47_13]
MIEEKNKSRIFELKQKLLRRAWDGKSGLAANGAEMILLIQMRLAQCQLPKGDHEEMMRNSQLMDTGQPKSVRMLNTLARYNGDAIRYSETENMTLH